jgi:hypothetical protein
VGTTPEMPRNEVNDDKDQTCSDGLHFCSQGYLGFYGAGGRTMILKVNPRDVVSIPSDYDNAKGRACKYEVIGELEAKPDTGHSFDTSVYNGVSREQAMDGEEFITIAEAGRRLNLTMAEILDYVEDGEVASILENGEPLVVWYVDEESGGYPSLDESESNLVDPVVGGHGERLLTLQEAADELCGDALKPMAALRKRISRGSVQTRWVNGEEKVVTT